MEKKFIGGWTLSNWGGVQVIDIDSDSMLVQYYDDEPETCEIQYEYTESEEMEARAYIVVGSLTLYLDECMRYL